MLRNLLFIAQKDFSYMLKARETLVFLFIMPVVFMYFIGAVTGRFAPTSGATRDVLTLWPGSQPGFLLDQLVHHLESDYRIARAGSQQELASAGRQLKIPEKFTERVLAGVPVTVQFHSNRESSLSTDYDEFRISRAIYTLLAELLVAGTPETPPGAEDFERLNGMPRSLSVDVKPAGRREKIPSGYEQAIPGIMVMFSLLVMTTSGAVLLVIERKQGLLRRLASTPISRLAVAQGKWCGKLALGLIQIAFAMLAGTFLFDMDWGPDLWTVCLVMVLYAGLMAALGLLLGSLAESEGQAIALGVVSTNLLAALGGCWWPVEITPRWMQALARLLPTGWAMDALHRLISFQAGPASVTYHLLALSLATVLLLYAAGRLFRFE